MKQILLFFFLSIQLYAQPGGGGGLCIANIYDSSLEKIAFEKLIVRTFVLKNNKIYQENFSQQKSSRYSCAEKGIYLPPTEDLDGDRFTDKNSAQRVLIIYKKDTMLIDFFNILGENGMGNIDIMDSVLLQKGYFKYDRGFRADNKTHRATMKPGLTIANRKILIDEAYLEYNPKIDLSFLLDKNLPASYFKKRARYHIQQKDSTAAFADINRAILKEDGNKDCETLILLCDANVLAKRYEAAIKAISDALRCRRMYYGEFSEEENYRIRAGLYIKTGQFEEALEDYNKLIRVAENPLAANIERADFKIRYLNKTASAIADLSAVIDKIPDKHLNDRPQGWSEYTDTYFALGHAFYADKNYDKAFVCWLKAMEFGYAQTSSDHAVVHFDSIIAQQPKAATPYLCRALALYRRGPYQGWGDDTKNSFRQGLKDIDMAESLGFKDFRINLYRASLLTQLKEHEAAFKEIELAIQKKNDDPRCYIVKYDIRRNLGQVIWGNKSDPDIIKIAELNKLWKFERW
jgi:tetratricopeptide (TPR) repeat protein